MRRNFKFVWQKKNLRYFRIILLLSVKASKLHLILIISQGENCHAGKQQGELLVRGSRQLYHSRFLENKKKIFAGKVLIQKS